MATEAAMKRAREHFHGCTLSDCPCCARLAELLDAWAQEARLEEAEDWPHDSKCRSIQPSELENADNCNCYRRERIAALEQHKEGQS